MMKEGKGYAKVHWCGNPKCEEAIKAETKATTRCIADENGVGKCIYCGKESKEAWYIAQSY
jgi:prolyl-tRNA synthetase